MTSLCGLYSVVLGLMDTRAGLCCRVSSLLSLFSMGNSYLSTTQAACQLCPSPCSLSLSLSLIHHLSFFLPPPSLCFLLLLECSAWQHLSAACLLSAAPHHGERETERCAGKELQDIGDISTTCIVVTKRFEKPGCCKNVTVSHSQGMGLILISCTIREIREM